MPSKNGPFDSEEAINEATAQKYLVESSGRENHNADFYHHALPHVLRGQAPTFTQADLQRKNIITRFGSLKATLLIDRQYQDSKIQDISSGDCLWTLKLPIEDEFEVTIVDWAETGWYPNYWEYGTAFCAVGRWDGDWGLSWFQTLRFELS